MKKILNFIDNKYYLKFIFYIIIFSCFSIGFFYIDKANQNSDFMKIFSFSQDFLSTILVMIIGSIITVITVTFSTIMVVLTLYSGQFSPRTLNDFMQRKVPLNILGYFIGIAVYAILGLSLSASNTDIIFSSMTLFSMIIFLVGIILFAYYIHYVSKSVQINIYIDKLVKDAVDEINTYQKTISEDSFVYLNSDEDQEDIEYDKDYHSKKTGYFLDIELEKLINYLKENDVYVTVVKPYNEHVFEDDILFKYKSKSNFKFDEEILDSCFIFGEEPTNRNTYSNKTMKLVEIAVRALSPGINDPVTAMNCIDQIGYVFMKLSDSHYSLYYKDEEGKERLVIKTMNFDNLLYDHFYQINLYGKTDLKITSRLIRALTRIGSDSNIEMKKSLWDFAKYIIKDIDFRNIHKFDFNEINYELKELALVTKNAEDYKNIIGK